MFQENILLAGLASYKIGGPARYFFAADTVDELVKAVQEIKQKNLEFFVLGGGTNLLIDDRGFGGLVVKPNFNFIRKLSNEEVSVGAGAAIAELLDFLIEHSLSGLEWAGGLPGTVGGAIRGNAGAFGGEIKDVIRRVRSLDTETLEEIERSAPECDFEYRSSIFKKVPGKEIILSAVLALKQGDKAAIEKAVKDKIAYRHARHPLEYPNIGSIFKNVDVRQVPDIHLSRLKSVMKIDPFPVIPTAYLIAEAGLKGVSCGGAMISPRHTNFIVNVLQASAKDVENLITLAKDTVNQRFGIILEEEIIRV